MPCKGYAHASSWIIGALEAIGSIARCFRPNKKAMPMPMPMSMLRYSVITISSDSHWTRGRAKDAAISLDADLKVRRRSLGISI